MKGRRDAMLVTALTVHIGGACFAEAEPLDKSIRCTLAWEGCVGLRTGGETLECPDGITERGDKVLTFIGDRMNFNGTEIIVAKNECKTTECSIASASVSRSFGEGIVREATDVDLNRLEGTARVHRSKDYEGSIGALFVNIFIGQCSVVNAAPKF